LLSARLSQTNRAEGKTLRTKSARRPSKLSTCRKSKLNCDPCWTISTEGATAAAETHPGKEEEEEVEEEEEGVGVEEEDEVDW
jgi:hypothetical protein